MRKTIALFVPVVAGVLLLALHSCRPADPAEELRPLVERYVEFWNSGRFEGMDKVLHPEFELRMSPGFGPKQGIEVFKKEVEKWRTAYPDFKVTVVESVWDADKVAARWTITATNTGPGLHPPTGKHVEVMGISILHFEQGLIRDEWIAGNDYLWMEQLGFTFVPPAALQQ